MQAHITKPKPSFDQLPDWLNPEEVRVFLGLGRSTVYELIRSQQLPSRRFGRRIRIPKVALAPRDVQVSA
ncbi:MAG: helix-turn-helix domain-containing protein [Nitrospira sp.]